LTLQYPGIDSEQIIYEGNYWVEELFRWLRNNYREEFFIWGHFYETHEGSELSLLKKGLISEDKVVCGQIYSEDLKGWH